VPEFAEVKGEKKDTLEGTKNALAKAFERVPAPAHGDAPASGELEFADAWRLIFLCLPRGVQSPDRLPDIVVPDGIAQDRDSRRRMAYRIGALSARELGLDAGGFDTEDLIALGRQTVADHAMAGTADNVLVALARAEGKVDETAWATGDQDTVAAQVSAFLESEFKDEIGLYRALEGLAAEPPLLGRKELAADLLRRHDIDPDALLKGSDPDYFRNNVSASSPPLVRNRKAGEYYFNQDTLTADGIRKLKMRGGGTPTDAHIEQMLRELPVSLDAEFTKRFDSHQQRMSTLLATWLSARLSLHVRQAGIDPAGAQVTISRAKMRLFAPPAGMRLGAEVKYSDTYGSRPSCGFLISIQAADRAHQCFISNRTGRVHVLPDGESAESWLKKEHELVFEDAAAHAELATRPGRWFPRVIVEEAVSGPLDSIRERLSVMFHAEIEQGREAARGETATEGMVDTLLNLIPFRQMVVALRKGDIPTAIVTGGLDALSLIPLVGTGIRLGGAAARSAAPWLSMGMRFGGAAGRQGLNGLPRLASRIAALPDRIKGSLATSAIRGWGRLRPLDVRRVAQALRPTAPKLASMLDDIATQARGASIPDGVWRVQNDTVGTAAAGTRESISAIPAVSARNLRGNRLALLPYGERAGAYTQVDATGQRVGALLVADSGGWLHQTMPVASLERYRVNTPDIVQILAGTRIDANGTIALNRAHYARLGTDYVQVMPDHAVSTALRPIWRVAAPQGIAADVIAHRLLYDTEEGLWRQADAPGLAGGGNVQPRLQLRSRGQSAATPGQRARMTPGVAQMAQFQNALLAGVRGATPGQVKTLRALLDWTERDRRGLAILRAMCAHYHLLGQVPEIDLCEGAVGARLRPSLGQPVYGNTWHLDLEAIKYRTREETVDEFAAVYNNMTGLLQNYEPFGLMLAESEPALDAGLEQAWTNWLEQDPNRESYPAPQGGGDASTLTPRQRAVNELRTRLREMLCYGGLDKSTFKSLLRNQHGRWAMRIDLSHRGLDSVPPLPGDTQTLIMSHNHVRDWSNLPAELTTLRADGTHMARLPANLPAGLIDLDVSANFLKGSILIFPSGLARLDIGRNYFSSVPRLPASLKELIISGNQLRNLSRNLPAGLTLLDASSNSLAQLPANLPSGLQVLYVAGNLLTRLPASLPPRLTELDVSANFLYALPVLPDALRILEVNSNVLQELPDGLPRALEMILAAGNRLRRLPNDLPPGLRVLALQRNAIAELPDNITTLESATIHLDGNPLSVANIPVVAADRAGPRIFFSVRATPDQRVQSVRTLRQAVQYWWTQASPDTLARWDAIALAVGAEDNAAQFSLFLDLLRTTICYRDPAFRAQVEDWLTELAKPECKALLDETLAVCMGATETCEDRLLLAWNDMQALRVNDDIRRGLYDDRLNEVVDIARQMFRINVLGEIARNKERTLTMPDEVEVYLAYVANLRDSLGLATIAPGMRYFSVSDVTATDLAEARETVLARERQEFDKFLVLDYEPWQTLLRRKNSQAYADAEKQAHGLLDVFEQRLRQEVDKLGLDGQDTALLADARKDLGPVIMREIRYSALEPLTRAARTGIDMP
jgi:Leucine-rich repeat (LRR) protein